MTVEPPGRPGGDGVTASGAVRTSRATHPLYYIVSITTSLLHRLYYNVSITTSLAAIASYRDRSCCDSALCALPKIIDPGKGQGSDVLREEG